MRIRKNIGGLLVTICICFFYNDSFAEPSNLSLFKKELKVYYDSGLYEQELKYIINKARNYINKQLIINKNKVAKLAIVLDIDETSISNYKYMLRRDFGELHDFFHKEMLEAEAPPICATLALYNEAIAKGIKVFFVTGRSMAKLKATKINLIRAGFKKWAGLYLRPINYKQHSIISFKAEARENITKLGYKIIASIGDQESDIKGGFAQKGFKLPNPFYHIP